MKYVFTRTYVGPNNESFYRGSEVPVNFPKDVLERFVRDGLIISVETPNEFITKVNKRGRKAEVEGAEELDGVETLDPDRQPRSK